MPVGPFGVPKRGAYYAYRAGAEVARWMPYRLGSPLAHALTQAFPVMFAGRRRQVERNLRRVHGPDFGGVELQRAVRETFDSYGRYFYELFRLPELSPEWINAHFECHGVEQIAYAVAQGHGAVLALPHLGNWDLAGAWLALQGFQVTVVAELIDPPELFDWFVETRSHVGMRVIPLTPSAGGEVLRALHANEVVCLLCDRDLTGDGVDVEFFGEHTTMPAGPAMLAIRGGAPLLPAGCYFCPEGRSETTVLPPVSTERAGRIRDDVGRVTQELAHRFEDLIRVAPTHWHLLQPNWPSDRAAASVGDRRRAMG
jgi:lauroyl/myristoyl acyltransferase